MRGNSWLQAGNPTSSGDFAYKAIKTQGNTKDQLSIASREKIKTELISVMS